MNDSIDIIPPASRQLAPLYRKWDGEFEPCKAFMVLLRSGKVHFDFTTDGTHTFDIHFGREWIWYVPPELTREELEAFGTKVKGLLDRVRQGIYVSYDENSCEERGALTSDALEAREKIQDQCDRLFERVANHDLGVEIIEPFDYFEDESPEEYGLDAESTDAEIRKEADDLLKHFNANNMMMDGDVFEAVKYWVQNYQNYDK